MAETIYATQSVPTEKAEEHYITPIPFAEKKQYVIEQIGEDIS